MSIIKHVESDLPNGKIRFHNIKKNNLPLQDGRRIAKDYKPYWGYVRINIKIRHEISN